MRLLRGDRLNAGSGDVSIEAILVGRDANATADVVAKDVLPVDGEREIFGETAGRQGLQSDTITRTKTLIGHDGSRKWQYCAIKIIHLMFKMSMSYESR